MSDEFDPGGRDNRMPIARHMIDHDPNEKRPVKRGWSLSATVGIALAAVIGIGAVVAQGAGYGPGGWGNGGPGGMGARFIEHRLYAVLDDAGVSDEQQDQIWAIIDRTRSELRPTGRGFRDAREQVAMLLSAATIDTAALEKLRTERVAAIDAASKKAVAAAVEAAQLLTAEQRAKLAAEMKERRDRW